MEGPIQDPSPLSLDHTLHGNLRAAAGGPWAGTSDSQSSPQQPVQPSPVPAVTLSVLIFLLEVCWCRVSGGHPSTPIELCRARVRISVRLEAVVWLVGRRAGGREPRGGPRLP